MLDPGANLGTALHCPTQARGRPGLLVPEGLHASLSLPPSGLTHSARVSNAARLLPAASAATAFIAALATPRTTTTLAVTSPG